MHATQNWACWPPNVAEPEKVSHLSPPEERPTPVEEVSLENLLHRVVKVAAEAQKEFYEGLNKTASFRFGTGEKLPEITKENVWRHPNAHPLVLTLLLLDRYGKEYLDWDAETLRITLYREDVRLSNSVWTKIQAARVGLMAPSPWRQWEIFHSVARGLNGHQPNFTYLERPEMGHLAVAVDILGTMDPQRPWNEDVEKFVAAAAKDTGVPWLPAPLQFSQREIDKPKYICLNCGLKERDDNDVKCVHCGSTKLKRVTENDLTRRDKVATRFTQLSKVPVEDAFSILGENDVDIPVGRLLAHWEYRNLVRAQLLQQLRSLAKDLK